MARVPGGLAGQGRRAVGVLLALAAVLAVLAAIGLRFWTTSALWLDEAQSVAISRLPVPQLLDALRNDGSPPLYYLLLHAWSAQFGTGDFAVRSLSGLISMLTLPVMFRAGVRVGGTRRHGLLAAVVLAANPWALRYATEARMYALVALLVLLAGLALDRVMSAAGGPPGHGRRARWRPVVDIVLLGLATAGLLLTHYWAIFLLTVIGGVLLVQLRRPRRRAPALRALAGLALGAILFVPWLPSFLFQVRYTGAPWADVPGLARLAALPLEWSGGDTPPARWLVLVMWPLLVLGAVAVPTVRRRATGALGPTPGRVLALVVVLTLVLALIATRLTGSGIEVRYTAVVVPLVLLLITLGVRMLPRRQVAAVVAALVALGLLAGFDAARVQRTQAGDIAETIDTIADSGDVVIYCPDQLAPAVERLINPVGLVQVTVPRSRELAPVNWVDYERRVEQTLGDAIASGSVSRAQSGGAVWLLTSPRYRTHQRACEEVRRGLSRRGAKAQVMVPLDQKTYEYAVLERWALKPAKSSGRSSAGTDLPGS
ncbi:MAG: glycosyltransferase family 39 protein [Actinomycetota bacterium]|nr:glycosyltransferase family 39 protein [Actinomycetota bacterium]